VNLPLFIARRYFFSKKSQRAINIVSLISVIGVTVGTGALIVVLSVFNGFEQLVVSLYNSFDPDVKVTPAEGKLFSDSTLDEARLKAIRGVRYVCPVFEENALVRYGEKQYIATVKGVADDFLPMTRLDTMIAEGRFVLREGDLDYAVVGGGIAYTLQLNTGDLARQLDLYVPRRDVATLTDPSTAFNRRFLSAAGIFSIQQDFDSKYILVPMRFARDLFESEHGLTAVEIGLDPGANLEGVAQAVRAVAGPRFTVKDRFEQHAFLYRIMKSEKWAVFLILAFILLIATFNVIGSLSMLIIEKQHDMAVLHSMGAGQPLLRKIFFTEGLIITVIGTATGLLLGTAVCLLQMRYGFISLGSGGSFVIDAYPVRIQAMDFVYVMLTVFAIGFFAAWYPVKKLVEKRLPVNLVREEQG
jgi:lipoprotein-releasing system permease protein